MDKISIAKIYKHWPIVINEQGFRRLYDELNKLLDEDKKISFKINYSDKSSIDTESLNILVNDENRRGRRITEIAILATGKNKEVKILFGQTKLTKDENKYYPNIYLDITGPERQWVFVAQSQIEERLKSFKSSHPSRLIIAIITLLVISGLGVLISYLLKKPLHFLYTYNPTTNADELNNYFVSILFILNLLIGIPIILLYKDITFAIGAEVEKHQNRLRAKSNLFWVVLIGVPLSIIVTIILNYLNIK